MKNEMLLLLHDNITEFKLHYGGSQHQIDANTFVNSLIHNINLIEEINRTLDPNKKIDIKVKAPERGSFVIEIALQATNIVEDIKLFFADSNVSYAANLITTLGGLYGFYKFLEGKKPDKSEKKDDNTYIVTNGNGNTITVNKNILNIYQNKPVVREIICKNFETLENDPNIESFDILQSDDLPIITIPQSDFEQLSNVEFEEKSNEKIERVKTILRILRPSFERNLKSDLYWEGIKINVKIIDESFLKKIDDGEKFAKGDFLEVEMEILKKYDDSIDAFINKSYTIIKVIEHHPRGTQLSIEDK